MRRAAACVSAACSPTCARRRRPTRATRACRRCRHRLLSTHGWGLHLLRDEGRRIAAAQIRGAAVAPPRPRRARIWRARGRRWPHHGRAAVTTPVERPFWGTHARGVVRRRCFSLRFAFGDFRVLAARAVPPLLLCSGEQRRPRRSQAVVGVGRAQRRGPPVLVRLGVGV